jgi:hypothetical protein
LHHQTRISKELYPIAFSDANLNSVIIIVLFTNRQAGNRSFQEHFQPAAGIYYPVAISEADVIIRCKI